MTEADALEVAGIFAGNALNAFSVYISFTTAYLVAAYYVGARLTSFQSLAVSGLYLVASTAYMLALVMNVGLFGDAMAASTIGNAAPLASGLAWSVGMSILCTGRIIVFLIYIWQVRRPKTD